MSARLLGQRVFVELDFKSRVLTGIVIFELELFGLRPVGSRSLDLPGEQLPGQTLPAESRGQPLQLTEQLPGQALRAESREQPLPLIVQLPRLSTAGAVSLRRGHRQHSTSTECDSDISTNLAIFEAAQC
ncbi:unnamed protein product [Polarella glacialis]|uniref:Uncharacterized protein n=1 Tax=Polarella glacialis TaxID=89957 RepID=A0A813KE98_POLGL|nr:unnamed protein product [Polarella glacialis]